VGSLDGYDPTGDIPLGGYVTLTALFGAAVAGAAAAGRATGRELPDRFSAGDVALLSFGTHKLSRMLAKDRVLSFARAPFARRSGESTPPGEVEDEPRGGGLQRATGELVTCPGCVGLWVAAALTAGMAVAPRETRMAATALTALTASDFLHAAYMAAERYSKSVGE
jgi:hypothetical protein